MTLEQHLAAMKDGEQMEVSRDGERIATVSYHAEQATGDDGRPAPGYTVGLYWVREPIFGARGRSESFRHSPQGPTLSMAKTYAAGQAAAFITKLMRGAA